MTIELATVEPPAKPVRFGGSPLQQHARSGLALTIVDFRKMCQEICQSAVLSEVDQHELEALLVDWMTKTAEQ